MHTRFTRLTVTVAALAAALATTLTTAGPASAAATPGTYAAAAPTRVLDTRAGIGAMPAKIASGATLTFSSTAGLGDPVSAVALNITVVDPVGAGYVTVWAAGTLRVPGSTVNFLPGRITANSTIVRPAADGRVSVYNGSTGAVDLVADRTGWWGGGTVDAGTAGALNAMTSTRLLDTRLVGGPLTALTARKVPVRGRVGVPTSNVSAVAVNLTVASPTRSGYLVAGAELAQPGFRTSSVNFLAEQNRANLSVLPVNPDGSITIFNASAGSTHVVIDVLGYFNDGTPSADGAFVPSTSYRAVDTRSTQSALPALSTRKLAVLPNDGTALVFKALAVNITVAAPQATGYLTAWDGVDGIPATSNNNFVAGESSANSTILPVNPDGTVTIYNASYGNLDVVIDINGFVLNDLSALPCAALCVAAPGKARQSAVEHAVASARQFAARR